MLNPHAEYVFVKNLGVGQFGVFAKKYIPANTIVEVCPVKIITKREAIILEKTVPSIKASILIDPEIINKEAQVFTRLREMRLEERLDRGEITSEQFTKLLMSEMDAESLLDSHSHILVLGNGPLYQISENPNLVLEYHSEDKVVAFKSLRPINQGSLLTYYKQ